MSMLAASLGRPLSLCTLLLLQPAYVMLYQSSH